VLLIIYSKNLAKNAAAAARDVCVLRCGIRARAAFSGGGPDGVKPLISPSVTGASAFASESEGGCRPWTVERDVRLASAPRIQALAYRYVPAPRSGFKDVEKLRRGILPGRKTGRLSTKKSAGWLILTRQTDGEKSARKPRVARRMPAHRTRTQRRLISDVPLGFGFRPGSIRRWFCLRAGRLERSSPPFAREL